MLEKFPSGLVAVVSDSYDIHNAVDNIWGKELRAMVEKRDGCLVVRPDSGEPKEIVVQVCFPNNLSCKIALLICSFGLSSVNRASYGTQFYVVIDFEINKRDKD